MSSFLKTLDSWASTIGQKRETPWIRPPQNTDAWCKRSHSAWDHIKHNYDKMFYRMWKFYLQGCAGGFRAERMLV